MCVGVDYFMIFHFVLRARTQITNLLCVEGRSNQQGENLSLQQYGIYLLQILTYFPRKCCKKKGNQRDVLVSIGSRGALKKTPPHSNDVFEARSIRGVAKHILHFCNNGQIRLMWV